MIATRGFLAVLECTKFDFGWGSAPGPAGEAVSSPDPLAGLRGPTSKGEEKGGEGREREGREKEGRGRTGKGRDGPHLSKFPVPPKASRFPKLTVSRIDTGFNYRCSSILPFQLSTRAFYGELPNCLTVSCTLHLIFVRLKHTLTNGVTVYSCHRRPKYEI